MPLERFRRHFVTCVLGAVVLSGCQVSNSTKVAPVATVADRGGNTWYEQLARAPKTVVANNSNAQPSGDIIPVQSGTPGFPELVPVVATIPRHDVPPEPPNYEAPAPPGQSGAVDTFVMPASAVLPSETPMEDQPAFPRGTPQTPQMARSDIAAHPCFGHGPDYTWISGVAQKWRNEWRLRYASVDEVDSYGGCLKLSVDNVFGQLRDGEHYKLQGRLEIQDDKVGGAVFIIDRVQPVGY